MSDQLSKPLIPSGPTYKRISVNTHATTPQQDLPSHNRPELHLGQSSKNTTAWPDTHALVLFHDRYREPETTATEFDMACSSDEEDSVVEQMMNIEQDIQDGNTAMEDMQTSDGAQEPRKRNKGNNQVRDKIRLNKVF